MVKTRHCAALAVLVFLLAVSCGGRQGRKNAGDAQEDSLATAETVTPEAPKPAAVDTAMRNPSKHPLPEEPYFDIVTTMGTIRVKLYKDTPKHRNNFIRLARSHFYDGVQFHRVINGFVIQGGDPYTRDTSRIDEWGEGGPGYNIDAEILPEHTHKKGALAAARRGDLANPKKESSGSQFYIVQDADNCKHLDGEYTVFGETVGGLGVIDRIARTPTDRYNRPVNPIYITRIRPNDELNKRALEEEQRALEEGSLPDAAQEEAPPAMEAKPTEPTIEIQQTADSTVLRGRKLKHRE